MAGVRTWLLAAAVLGGAAGCGKKDKDDDAGGGGGGSGAPPSGVPAPPRAGRAETADWSARELADARREAKHKLRLIGLAAHAFHETYNGLPVGVYDKTGKKLGLSWRVAILPYVEEGALYKEFHLDEPWDSDHNKKLVGRMPKIFTLSGLSAGDGYTHLRGIGGEGALSLNPNAAGQPGMPARGPRLPHFTDGTSNTFLVCELDEPTVWTKPDEPVCEGKKPLPKFGGVFEDGFHAVMGDGSVRFLRHTVPDNVVRALVTRAGGEVIPND